MGLGSLLFSVPHFLTDSYSLHLDNNSSSTSDNVCRPAVRRDLAQYRQLEQITGLDGIGKLAEGIHGRSTDGQPHDQHPDLTWVGVRRQGAAWYG